MIKKINDSHEELEKYERIVSIFYILNELTTKQLKEVDKEGCIKVSLLTTKQLEKVEEALLFDYALSKISIEVSGNVYRFL